MAIRSNPAYQRALLRQQAINTATGRAITDTSEISAAAARQEEGMKSAFADIALSKKGRAERQRQFSKRLRLQKKDIEATKGELPWRIGLGLGTTALAAYQSYGNRQEAQRRANNQRLMASALQSQIEDQILFRELMMNKAKPGFFMTGEEQ